MTHSWLHHLACLLALVACGHSSAEAAEILWAGDFEVGANPPVNPQDALGAPNGLLAGFSTLDAEATYTTFAIAQSVDDSSLAALLGVPVATLQLADFVTFERNGTPGISYEGSTWTFRSGGSSVETVQVPGDSRVVASGAIDPASYASFFGLVPETQGDWPFVLIDLQEVDPTALDFEVTVLRGPDFFDTPDPDALGILEPQVLFADGFESGNITAWSGSSNP